MGILSKHLNNLAEYGVCFTISRRRQKKEIVKQSLFLCPLPHDHGKAAEGFAQKAHWVYHPDTDGNAISVH